MLKNKKKGIPKAEDKFLWVRFGALGDVLQALSAVFLIKEKSPEIKISFLTTEPYMKIVESQPYIDEVLIGQKKPWKTLIKTAKKIRNNQFKFVASTYKGSHMTFLNILAGVKNRLGDSVSFPFFQTQNIYSWAELNGIDLYNREKPSIFATEESIAFAKDLFLPYEGKKKLFAAIGAGIVSKRWPHEKWIEFLPPLISDGWQIVLNGHGEEERLFAEAIIDEIGSDSILNLVNRLDFLKMAAVVRECDMAIGNDTGPLHMASLSGIPTLGIFDYIQPAEVGYAMPWFACVVSRNEPLQTFYAKKRCQSVLAEISSDKVRRAFDFLAEKFLY